MKPALLLTALIITVGFLLGIRENQRLAILRTTHSKLLHEAAGLAIPSETSPTGTATKAAIRPRQEASTKIREMVAKLAKQPDRAKFMDDMISLKTDELKLLVAELKNSPDFDSQTRQDMISFSIMLLAERHPEAALALLADPAIKNGITRTTLFGVFELWAKDQPLAAVDWINTHAKSHPELVTDDAKAAVINGAATRDFALALQLVGELGVEPDHVMELIVQATATPEQQTEFLKELRRYAAGSGDKESAADLLSSGLENLLHHMLRSGADQAVEWVESSNLTSAEAGIVVGSLHYYRTKADTGKWLDWVATQPLTETQSEMIAWKMMKGWTEADYVAAGEWLSRLPEGSLREAATVPYIETIAGYEPDTAARWAATLPAGKQQSAMRGIHRELMRHDKGAAREFAKRHGIDATE